MKLFHFKKVNNYFVMGSQYFEKLSHYLEILSHYLKSQHFKSISIIQIYLVTIFLFYLGMGFNRNGSR